MSEYSSPYSGKKAVITTKHEKGKIVAPIFNQVLGLEVSECNLDTDTLGTFTGEIERKQSPRETVLIKARLGVEKTGESIGIASEGSIGADPFIPFINSDFEMMAFVDIDLDLEIVESIRSTNIIAATKIVHGQEDLSEFLKRADFPNHKLIVRTQKTPTIFSIKGIDDDLSLRKAIESAKKEDPKGVVVIESDLRAHCSPSRQKIIGELAAKLAIRIKQACPQCSTPGWGVVTYIKGVLCSQCQRLSIEALKQEVLGCSHCEFQENGRVIAEALDPARCDWCNP
jgi:hypothetical protein